MCLSIHLPIYLSTYLPIYLPTYVPIYLYTYLSIYLPIYVSTYLSIYVSIYLSTYLSTYLSMYLSACMPCASKFSQASKPRTQSRKAVGLGQTPGGIPTRRSTSRFQIERDICMYIYVYISIYIYMSDIPKIDPLEGRYNLHNRTVGPQLGCGSWKKSGIIVWTSKTPNSRAPTMRTPTKWIPNLQKQPCVFGNVALLYMLFFPVAAFTKAQLPTRNPRINTNVEEYQEFLVIASLSEASERGTKPLARPKRTLLTVSRAFLQSGLQGFRTQSPVTELAWFTGVAVVAHGEQDSFLLKMGLKDIDRQK